MPSADMLKKLLDEFVEKEQLVTEELRIITEQIGELETRLETCRVRLGTIGADRQRVTEIKQRYAGGPFYERQVTGSPAPVFASPTPAEAVGQAVSMAVAAAMNKNVNVSNDWMPEPIEPEPQPQPAIPEPPLPQPTYQEPPQPAYQEPPQPVYQEPPQPVYQEPPQPVYQEPPQPVYQEPPQPVFQEPPQPEAQQSYAEQELEEQPVPVKNTLGGINAILSNRREASIGGGDVTPPQDPNASMPPVPSYQSPTQAWDESAEESAPAPAAQSSEPAAEEEKESDTVKSINDALRSLFR